MTSALHWRRRNVLAALGASGSIGTGVLKRLGVMFDYSRRHVGTVVTLTLFDDREARLRLADLV